MVLRRPRRSLLPIAIILVIIGCRPNVETVVDVPTAVWSSTDERSNSPESAAVAAVDELLGITPVISDFMSGDSRSGEITIFSAGEGVWTVRSTLLLRQMGTDDRWSVLGAIGPGVVIAEPASGSTHASGWLTVSGRARGYEGTVIVSAHTAGDTPRLVDQAVVSAGSMAELEPFTTRLDLRQTTKGDVVAIVVRGDTGLESDPGEFSAIPIRIGF